MNGVRPEEHRSRIKGSVRSCFVLAVVPMIAFLISVYGYARNVLNDSARREERNPCFLCQKISTRGNHRGKTSGKQDKPLSFVPRTATLFCWADVGWNSGCISSPIQEAAVTGDFLVLESILAAGADPNTQVMISFAATVRGENSQTPIMLLFHELERYPIEGKVARRMKCAEFLRKRGASLEACDVDGRTALHCSILFLEAVNWLIAHHVDLNALNNQGETTLHLAAAENGYEKFTVPVEKTS